MTALRDNKKTNYKNYLNGRCEIRVDMDKYQVYVNKKDIFVFKEDSLYLTKRDDVISQGTFINNTLEGEGILITPELISKGMFHENILTEGIDISNLNDLSITNYITSDK